MVKQHIARHSLREQFFHRFPGIKTRRDPIIGKDIRSHFPVDVVTREEPQDTT
jgi:hypothetical protein